MPIPDQRAVPRLEVNAAASVQILGASSHANGQATAVTVLDASDRGMRLRSTAPMDPGQVVKIEMGDSMFLGEVCYCTPEPGDGDISFCLGIITKECLTGLASLRHLIESLTPETDRELERIR